MFLNDNFYENTSKMNASKIYAYIMLELCIIWPIVWSISVKCVLYIKAIKKNQTWYFDIVTAVTGLCVQHFVLWQCSMCSVIGAEYSILRSVCIQCFVIGSLLQFDSETKFQFSIKMLW
jgi:hypothetical protein